MTLHVCVLVSEPCACFGPVRRTWLDRFLGSRLERRADTQSFPTTHGAWGLEGSPLDVPVPLEQKFDPDEL
jgi:hypothetical protein